VGTMIGVWPKSTGLIGATGRDQVTSVIALYGPRTTVMVALDDGAYEFTYGAIPEGSDLDPKETPWICTRQQIQISPDSKIFSPANMRAAQELEGYKRLIDYYMTNRYTLRYTGGLVPDVYQQFTKKMGIFCNPTSEKSPAKLRLAFEAAPFGLIVEKAGGLTSDGVTGGSILDVRIDSVDQRTALCCGSANEVRRFNGKYRW
jgi:sedoheptulose-bisphosphatase